MSESEKTKCQTKTPKIEGSRHAGAGRPLVGTLVKKKIHMSMEFYELNIWEKGYQLLMEVYEVTEKYPNSEKYALSQATRRSANSVIANIAESQGRYFFKDKIRILYISRGEITETQSHLRVALGKKYIMPEKFKYLNEEYQGLIVGVNKYISNLNDRQKKYLTKST
jgi:four helix bundle protein